MKHPNYRSVTARGIFRSLRPSLPLSVEGAQAANRLAAHRRNELDHPTKVNPAAKAAVNRRRRKARRKHRQSTR